MINKKTTEQQRIEDEAARWVDFWHGEATSEADIDAFDQWICEDERHLEAYERFNSVWSDQNLWAAAQNVSRATQSSWFNWRNLSFSFSMRSMLPIAAVTASCLLALLVILPHDPPFSLEMKTVGAQSVHQTLPDGSKIVLNGRSNLSIRFTNSERAINLERGEFYIDVAKDERPLIVSADTTSIRAVGTQFSVDKKNVGVEVAVVEGTVEVKRGDARLLVYQDEVATVRQSIAKQHGSAQSRIAWMGGWIETDGIPLSELLEEINRHSLYPIRIADETLAQKEIAGRFSLASPDETLSVMAAVHNLRVIRTGVDIVLVPN